MDGAGTTAVRPVLAEVGRVNTLFAVETVPPGPGWLPLGGGGALEPRALAAEVERVRGHLARLAGRPDAVVEWRVAASVFQQGLATRLLSPVLAAGLCHGVLVDAARFHWDPRREGPVVLRTAQEGAAAVAGGTAELADWVEHTVVLGVLARAARGLTGAGGVAPGLLRGNTAAALAGAVRALGADRPAVRARAGEVAADLLGRPSLAGTGGYTGVDASGLGVFRRTTCCLYYRVPGAGYCGDCALRR
ncbi:(2Fe-2S)-binding protein [Nocardiopsis dassonvillei]|uniref:(2Fe-2S)-binding protein n=1 Tax=Nocardiopsis dassonvillei TaxID=2014 RepID=UPI00367267D3